MHDACEYAITARFSELETKISKQWRNIHAPPQPKLTEKAHELSVASL
jgi:hypothetical protein